MSAYIVRAESIATIASTLIERMENKGGELAVAKKLDVNPRIELARMMCDENIASIAARYPDTKGNEVQSFCNMHEKFWRTRAERKTDAASASDTLDLLSEYSYQSCEHEAWESSPVRKMVAIAEDWMKAEQTKEIKKRCEDERKARESARMLGNERLSMLKPTWAKSAIIATLKQSEVDTQTDYFNSSTQKTIVLAWSKHTRNLFPEMRKAALRFDKTAYLAKDGIEHRENYSMGKGTYLSGSGSPWASTWEIKKVAYFDDVATAIGESMENYKA